jgi:asparagine synthetase B (glutamine-hydrolysing)
MCGIAFFLKSLDTSGFEDVWQRVLEDISRRGPDLFHLIEHEVGVSESGQQQTVRYAGAVLHIQGKEITRQPFVDLFYNILLWNGEVFDGLQRSSTDDERSDTELISAEIERATRDLSVISDVGEAIALTLSRVHGPYAFIYFHGSSQAIFYGRDPFGRRSLVALSRQSSSSEQPHYRRHLLISSLCLERDLGEGYLLEELPVSGIFCLPLNHPDSPSLHFPWPVSRLKLERKESNPFETKLDSLSSCSSSPCSSRFLAILTHVLQKRIHCVHSLVEQLSVLPLKEEVSSPQTNETCTIGVLFSGGIDSVFLAALLHLSLPEEMSALTIDLLNVTFEGQNPSKDSVNDPSPDRLAAIAALGELEVCSGETLRSFIFL